jgi:type I restriction enzyme, S subunit
VSKWSTRPLYSLAPEVRETVDLTLLGDTEVEHYSIPALEATGRPDVVPASGILSGKQRLRGGEVMISRLNPRKARVLAVPLLSERPALASGEFVVLRPLGVDRRFLTYTLLAESTRQYLDSMVQSVTRSHQRIRPEQLMRIPVEVPPVESQRAIADFLDAETGRIDQLLRSRERQRALVAERFASSIESLLWSNAAVHAPALSVAVSIAEGQVDPGEPRYSETPLIAPNHVESGTGRVLDVTTAGEQGAISGKYLCRAGDVVYSKIRPALRKACIAPVDSLTSADMYPLRPNRGLLPRYLLYFLLSNRFTEFAVMESERVAMPKINRDAFGRIRIPMPSTDTQRRTIDQLDQESLRLEALSVTLERAAVVLQERKQALITAAVTGQLDLAREIAEEAS